MRERHSLSCECQFLVGSCVFPGILRVPEISTCDDGVNIPVETGLPPFLVIVKRQTQHVRGHSLMKGFGYFSASFRVSLFTSHYVLDAHHTAQVKGMPAH